MKDTNVDKIKSGRKGIKGPLRKNGGGLIKGREGRI